MRAIDIFRGLEGSMTRPVVFAEQAAKRPEYPYLTIKELVSFIPARGHASLKDEDQPVDIRRVATSQPTMSLSITAFGRDLVETNALAQEAHDWFSFDGYRELKEVGYVVTGLQSIMNRDSLIVDDYERKRGFDVTLRFVHQQSRTVEEIKVVKGTINNKPFTREVKSIDKY